MERIKGISKGTTNSREMLEYEQPGLGKRSAVVDTKEGSVWKENK